jgi:hypothetical protein
VPWRLGLTRIDVKSRCHSVRVNVPGIAVHTSLHHGVKSTLESVVLQGCSYALLVGELLVNLVVLGVRAVFHANVDPVIGGQTSLKAHTHGKTNYGGKAAVVDGGSKLDRDRGDGVQPGAHPGSRGRIKADIRKIDNGELSKSEGMLRIGNRGDQICETSAVPCSRRQL